MNIEDRIGYTFGALVIFGTIGMHFLYCGLPIAGGIFFVLALTLSILVWYL